MAKFGSFDSGGGEAPAILGEDLGAGLTFLLRPIAVTGCLQDIARLGEENLALGVLGALLGIETYCLVFAYQHRVPLLAVLVLVLMAAEIYTFRRSTAPVVEDDCNAFLVNTRCAVCRQHFAQERGYGKGPKGSGRRPRPADDVCSRECELNRTTRAA